VKGGKRKHFPSEEKTLSAKARMERGGKMEEGGRGDPRLESTHPKRGGPRAL